MRTGFACACLLLTAAAAPAAQQTAASDPARFRAAIEAVEIDVRVVDDRGHAVTGLARDDFEIYEEGVRQTVTAFTEIDVPFVASRPPLEPDVRSNRRPLDGRLYVLVLDDLHTHPLRASRVKQAARRFLDRHFAANDRAAVVVTSGRTDASQELTSSRRALLGAVDRFEGRKLRSSTLERIDQYYMTREMREPRNDGRPERIDDPTDAERGYNARVALGTLENVARWLGTVPARRKALLFVSEGIDYDIHDPFENREASTILASAREAVAVATRGNVTIYGIDPTGLTVDGGESIEVASLPEDTSLNLGVTSLQNELRLSQDSLRTLSDQTGGFAIVNANDLSAGFDRIVSDNTRYYLLGYQPSNQKRDGKFRAVEVRVKRPGLRVLARRGYVAAPAEPERRAEASEDAAPDLRPLLDSPIPVSDGFRTLSRLELPPGRYQVRIAARQQGADRGGSVVHDIVVPDYARAPLAMSDLVLASCGAAQALTTKPDPELRDRLTLPPTAARQFDPRDTLTVFAELYDNRARPADDVALVTTLSDASGKVVYRAEEPVEAFSFEPARKSWTHRVEIPLADVPQGSLVLRVEARPRAGSSPAVYREVPLEVGVKGRATT